MSMTLTLTQAGRTLDRFQFEEQEQVLVGRSEECEVRIDNLSVSRRHCELLRRAGFHLLRDLGSSNGTFVNGRRVSEHALNPGDVITVGEFTLTYEAEFPREPEVQPAGLMVHAPGTMPMMTMAIAPGAPAPSSEDGARAVSRARGYLTLEDQPGEPNHILQQAVLLIGADPAADLPLTGRFAPRLAALVLRERHTFRLLDVSPRGNAVRVNGKAVRNHELSSNDVVEVGGRRLRFQKGLPRVDDEPAAGQAAYPTTRRLERPTRRFTRAGEDPEA